MAKTRTKTKITIPTVDELEDRLAGLERLLIAKQWERAAIVWAFTRKGQGERTDLDGNPPKFPATISEFAGLGFAGLVVRETVAHYRDAWQAAIDQGKAKEVHPGDTADLPDLDWPPSLRTEYRGKQDDAEELKAAAAEAGIKSSTVLDVASNKEALKAAIKGSPAVRQAAAAAIRETAKDEDVVRDIVRENPEAVRAEIIENPDVRHAAFHAVQEGAELAFAGKEPPPDPDEREDRAQWNTMLVAKRVNTGLTELIRLTRDLALTGDMFHQGLTHQVNNMKIKADALYSMVHDGAAFDAALQELLDSEK